MQHYLCTHKQDQPFCNVKCPSLASTLFEAYGPISSINQTDPALRDDESPTRICFRLLGYWNACAQKTLPQAEQQSRLRQENSCHPLGQNPDGCAKPAAKTHETRVMAKPNIVHCLLCVTLTISAVCTEQKGAVLSAAGCSNINCLLAAKLFC